ncbi:MAG TPA: hypothetical protein VGI39_24405 [Polyangiaceae bacterium]|jgi:hypothetical protein
MRRLLLLVPLLAVLGGVGLAAPACSSKGSSDTDTNDAGGDASLPPYQLLGQPCDPKLAHACSPAPPCFAIYCDPDVHICREQNAPCAGQGDAASFLGQDSGVPVDAGRSLYGPCYTDHDCVPDSGQRCGYPFTGGCSATGSCVAPEPPANDAGKVYTACGCNGQAVPYVTETTCAAPVSSPGQCEVDSGVVDAGSPGDASADAGSADGGSADAAGE